MDERGFNPEALDNQIKIEKAFADSEKENALRLRFGNVILMKGQFDKTESFKLVAETAPLFSKIFEKKTAISISRSESILGDGSNVSTKGCDEIAIAPIFENIDELPDYLFHELGHSLETRLKLIAREKKVSLPRDTTQQMLADLCACYVLRPQSFEKNSANTLARDTYACFEEVFSGVDMVSLRKKVADFITQAKDKERKNYQIILDTMPNFKVPHWMDADYVYEPFTDDGISELVKQSSATK